MGALGTRHSPRPLFGRNCSCTTRAHRAAGMRGRVGKQCGCLKVESVAIHDCERAMTMRRPRARGAHNHPQPVGAEVVSHYAKMRGRGVWVPAFAGTTQNEGSVF